MPSRKKPKNDPHEMTTDELASFAFHPKVVEHVKRVAHQEPRKPPKKK